MIGDSDSDEALQTRLAAPSFETNDQGASRPIPDGPGSYLRCMAPTAKRPRPQYGLTLDLFTKLDIFMGWLYGCYQIDAAHLPASAEW